jgi:16S rRNA (guanine966-N2)-methyltransferase
VITGSARGIRLDAPKGAARPTMDKVRAAVFSALGDAVPGATVLDLFAGSGGYAIEALSRGASRAVLVDSDPSACACIRRNLGRASLEGVVQTMDAFRFLELYAPDAGFDLVFADPPYAKSREQRQFAAELLAGGGVSNALPEGGLFVLERSPEADADSPGLSLLKRKRYGETEILIYRRSAECLPGLVADG